MKKDIFVIGHKNPDTDSICSAIAYAHLKNQLSKEKENYVPIIRREMQSFLKVMLQIASPHLILEVGTAVGFSTLLMSEYAPKDCIITTIKN